MRLGRGKVNAGDIILVMALGMIMTAMILMVWAIGGTGDKPLTLPTNTFRCPEDADMVVRYGVEPAGMVAFCVYSDDMEGIID